jgi:4a-hydroxytetrahydrobiopterin dehydratase
MAELGSMKLLTPTEIRSARSSVPLWRRHGKTIRRELVFTDFVGAMKFVNAVARAAEKAQHHPDIDIRWNQVTLTLSTHDAGGLTANDFALAAVVDRCAAK